MELIGVLAPCCGFKRSCSPARTPSKAHASLAANGQSHRQQSHPAPGVIAKRMRRPSLAAVAVKGKLGNRVGVASNQPAASHLHASNDSFAPGSVSCDAFQRGRLCRVSRVSCCDVVVIVAGHFYQQTPTSSAQAPKELLTTGPLQACCNTASEVGQESAVTFCTTCAVHASNVKPQRDASWRHVPEASNVFLSIAILLLLAGMSTMNCRPCTCRSGQRCRVLCSAAARHRIMRDYCVGAFVHCLCQDTGLSKDQHKHHMSLQLECRPLHRCCSC